MARSGAPSCVSRPGSNRSAATRQQLVEAAIETLKELGFAGASARAIAERGGTNQGLIFYHFGSVANLLLAALDSVSEGRMKKYSLAVANCESATELVDVAASVFREDLDAGHVTVLVEMIAGTSSTPGLGPEVAARIGPWFDFAQGAIEKTLRDSHLGSVVPSGDMAYGIVALYLGLELLTHLDGNRAPALNLFSHAGKLAVLIEALTPQSQGKEAT